MMYFIFASVIGVTSGVRNVSATPCDVVDVRLSIGTSTLLEFDEEPTLTFHADDQHFILKNNEAAKRSIAIIPVIKDQDVQKLFGETNKYPSAQALSSLLDRTYRTNLFVFFKNGGRLIFRLRFVEKNEADYVLKLKRIFRKGCYI